MNNRARHYAEALYRALRGRSGEEADAIIARFSTLLTEHHHTALYPSIVREYEKLARARGRHAGVVITVPDAQDRERHATALREDIETLGASSGAEVVAIDPTLVGGYAVEAGGVRIDRTHKRTLLELYQALINHV